MQITDEMVEKACLAYWGDKNMNSMFRGKTREGVATSMRAALEAALCDYQERLHYAEGRETPRRGDPTIFDDAEGRN